MNNSEAPQAALGAASPAEWVAAYWLSGLLLLVVGAWLLCPQDQCAPNAFDRTGLTLAQDWRSAALDPWMRGFTWAGSLLALLPLAMLAMGRLFWLKRRLEAGFVLLSLCGASVLAHLTKLAVARPRPDLFTNAVAMPADWSYPSAHAMQITALTVAWLLVARRGRWPWALAVIPALALVGLSRVYLQVHYPSDVLVGTLAAALWVLGLHQLLFAPGAGGTRRAAERGMA
jgi:undecaprenyl-diphosphatase